MRSRSVPEAKTLYINLKLRNPDYVELRYHFDNPNQYEARSLPLSEIANLLQQAETDYYTSRPVDFTTTGQQLYNWLDGSDRWLSRAISERRDKVVLAIATTENLAHLPWEVLHDGKGFLVEQLSPAVVPVRWLSDVKTADIAPENRPLQVLFMACSPLNTSPVLDFEGEEAKILAATARQPLVLTVEESGFLQELGNLVKSYDNSYFDILHLTGHADIIDGVPRFLTETETGECYPACAEEIAEALQFSLPPLIFLSGCRTGQAGEAGAVPSMAEQLLKFGATAVFGWGRPVLEGDATEAAATLYSELSAGSELAEAVAKTYRALIKNKARHWHLLRLYVAGTIPGALVTPLKTPKRQPITVRSATTRFLDPSGKVKVASRESFVGRRRQIQSCLRFLTQSFEEIGVLIHGMGGLGKSTLAARLCDRLTYFESVVWIGRIEEASLVNRLSRCFDNSPEAREILQSQDEPLDVRLRRVFNPDLGESQQLLLVFDDFEDNLEARNGGFVLSPEAVRVFLALVDAIRETNAAHRIIITCRYDFDFSGLRYFYKQPLDGLRDADLEKKCNRLASFDAESQVEAALQEKAITLADGNPRLLEWLDKILQKPSQVEVNQILSQLEANPTELREQVLAETLLKQINQPMQEILRRGLIFELPVPREALETIAADIAHFNQNIDQAVALGLLEVSFDNSLRVPRILPIQLSEKAEVLYPQATQVLYRLWAVEAETATEEQRLEIHRLALRGKEEEIAVEMAYRLTSDWNNSSRYREAVKTCQDTLEIVEDYRIIHNLAISETELGYVSKALEHYQQALDICPPDDEEQKAVILNDLGNLKADQGKIKEACDRYHQSLELNKSIGNIQGQAATLQNLGNLKADQGKIKEAITLYQQSLKLKERIGNVQGQAATLHQLGNLKANLGKIEEASALYQKSLKLNKSIGNIQGQAATLHQLGNLKANLGKIEEASARYQQSLELTESIGNVRGKAATLHQLGSLKADQGKIEEAIALFYKSLELNELIGNVKEKAMTLWRLGHIAEQQGNFATAVEYLQQCLEILERIKSPDAQAVREMLARVQSKLL